MTRVDVAIIGGGAIGLSSGYALTSRGLSVAVLEADELATGSSSGNAGHIVPSHVIPFAAPGMPLTGLKDLFNKHGAFGIDPRAGVSLIPFLLRFAMNCTTKNVERGIPALTDLHALSVEQLHLWAGESGWTNAMRPHGLLQVFRSQAGLAGGVREAEHMQQAGVAIKVLGADEVRALEPGILAGAVGGVHLVNDGSLDPGQFLTDLAGAITSRGSHVVTNARITKVTRTSGGFEIVAGDSVVQAEQIVIAAGVWSQEVTRLVGSKVKVPLMPARGYSSTLRLRTDAAFTHAMILGEAHVAVTPLGSRVRLTGRYELAGKGRDINDKRVLNLSHAAREYLELPSSMHVESKWTGLRPSTPDGLPMIGRLRDLPSVVLATGHGMLGTSLGAGTGELVARIITNAQAGVRTSAMDPNRF